MLDCPGELVHSESKAVMHMVGAVSCPGQKKERALRVRRQREDGVQETYNDGLAREARDPGSCTSTRAVGCGLRTQARSSSSRSNEVFFQNPQGSPAGLW